MRTEIARKLMATTSAGALGVLLLAAPALAQGQDRGEGRGGLHAGQNVRGSDQMHSTGQVRGGQTERGVRVRADTRANVRTNVEGNVWTRNDVRVRGNANTNVRAGIRTDRREAWSGDVRSRDARWRYRDRGTSVRVGVGLSDPYYTYGYDDGYYAYGAAEPYAYRGYSSEAYHSYAASPGCTCAPAPYASWNNTGWGWGGGRW
jgi:hypothetical protein